MGGVYSCRSCNAHFKATRRQCSVCGTAGMETDRETCVSCGTTLADSPVQQCPRCGSSDVELIARE
ncbi:hypothetical protein CHINAEXTREME_05305 [Halobiforma lacisalsi AJ5]|uniref:DZANK-type domain-containing protein n=2 Tax=Natronobacterium TaxID=2256 RepID=M0LKC0_NATLA|nr:MULTISPECIES: hypothetical protein [Halobiforma]APW97223.1 hypothetical protein CHINAEXTREME_05305 [Halobiforma lacisalsi AJ5]EMA34057.1 hypothetical protein C445_08567 [Halobiforma lacisalsi AJ5]SFC17517.1 hypothetical protein SAMN05444422_105131 [Halobiforma haloterrestris]